MVPPNSNRSPGARLTSFATNSFSNIRLSQRQMDNASQLPPGPQYPAGNDPDRYNTVDASFRHPARGQHNPGYAADGYLNNNLGGSWSYNGGANTVNGAMGESRLRSGARRAVIPAVRFSFSLPTFFSSFLPPRPRGLIGFEDFFFGD